MKTSSSYFLAMLIFNLFFPSPGLGQEIKRSDSKPGPPRIIRKSRGVLQQSAIKRVDPVYPPQALALGITGQVVVEITTDEEGNVIATRALSGHKLLKEAAVEAARAWTFVPTKLSGTPVKVVGTLMFNFTLGHSDSVDREIEHYKTKAGENPRSPEVYLMLAQAYIKAKRNQEAKDALERAISLNPNLPEAHYQLGLACLNQGGNEAAIAAFKRAIELEPNHGMAHHSLGAAYSNLGREEDAIRELEEALRLDPDNTETHFLLGHAYFRTGKYEEAITELKQAPPLEPYRSNTHVWMGLSYFKLGDIEAAMREHKILKKINKDAAAYLLKEIKK